MTAALVTAVLVLVLAAIFAGVMAAHCVDGFRAVALRAGLLAAFTAAAGGFLLGVVLGSAA